MVDWSVPTEGQQTFASEGDLILELRTLSLVEALFPLSLTHRPRRKRLAFLF